MKRPQFALKTLLWLMAVVAAFYAGIRFERERQRRESVDIALKAITNGLRGTND